MTRYEQLEYDRSITFASPGVYISDDGSDSDLSSLSGSSWSPSLTATASTNGANATASSPHEVVSVGCQTFPPSIIKKPRKTVVWADKGECVKTASGDRGSSREYPIRYPIERSPLAFRQLPGVASFCKYPVISTCVFAAAAVESLTGQDTEDELTETAVECNNGTGSGAAQSLSSLDKCGPPRAHSQWGLAKSIAHVAVGILVGAAVVLKRR